jgi:hypothetical protein
MGLRTISSLEKMSTGDVNPEEVMEAMASLVSCFPSFLSLSPLSKDRHGGLIKCSVLSTQSSGEPAFFLLLSLELPGWKQKNVFPGQGWRMEM